MFDSQRSNDMAIALRDTSILVLDCQKYERAVQRIE